MLSPFGSGGTGDGTWLAQHLVCPSANPDHNGHSLLPSEFKACSP